VHKDPVSNLSLVIALFKGRKKTQWNGVKHCRTHQYAPMPASAPASPDPYLRCGEKGEKATGLREPGHAAAVSLGLKLYLGGGIRLV